MSQHLRFILMTTALVSLTAGAAAASSFEDALEATYTTNPRILAQRQQLESTDENVAQALSGFRPTIGAQYDVGRQRTAFGGADWTYGLGATKALTVSQPLFSGGGTWSSYKSARQRVEAGQYTLSAVEQDALMQAVTAYMDVIADSAILDIARSNVQVLEDQLKSSNTRFAVGEATRTDVAQSESRLSDAKSSVIAAEGQLTNAIAAFTRVAGYMPEGTLTVPDKLPELPASLDEALERARAANPQLLAALHAAKASSYDVRTNEAVLLPTVSLVGSLTRQQGAGADGLSNFDQDKVGLEMNIPLYQSGAEYSRVREAEAINRQRDHQSIDTRMQTDQTVTQNWQQLQTAIATITSREDQIKAAQVALDGVRQEQQYGTRTIRDILDAQLELFNARTSLVHAQRDRIVDAYALALSLGQLTPENLGLKVAEYDPTVHADDVKWKAIGF
jgi:outer membrane protein